MCISVYFRMRKASFLAFKPFFTVAVILCLSTIITCYLININLIIKLKMDGSGEIYVDLTGQEEKEGINPEHRGRVYEPHRNLKRVRR